MLIIFDCDGVLVDSEPIAARVTGQYLKDLGYPADAEPHARFVGLSIPRMKAMLEAETGVALPADFEAELLRRDKAAFADQLRPAPGVAEAIPALREARCVASSGSQDKIRNSLTVTGLLAYFDPYLFSALDPEVENGKPAPDLFVHAAGTMAVPPARCVVIEDAVPGVVAGRAAGMRVLGFTGGGHCGPGHGRKLIDAGADTVFDDMTELASIL